MDSIDHILNELFFGLTESSSVGNIENSVVGFRVLSVNTSDLDLVLIGDLVELFLLLHELWKIDVHGCSHSSTKVGWARGNITEMIIMGEFDISGFEVSNSSAESVEDLNDTSILLH